MSYELQFHPAALDEWRKLDHAIRETLKRSLAERLENPRVPASRLPGGRDRYKIELRSAGYRLVDEVRDGVLVVPVVAVGRRDRNAVYKAADRR